MCHLFVNVRAKTPLQYMACELLHYLPDDIVCGLRPQHVLPLGLGEAAGDHVHLLHRGFRALERGQLLDGAPSPPGLCLGLGGRARHLRLQRGLDVEA